MSILTAKYSTVYTQRWGCLCVPVVRSLQTEFVALQSGGDVGVAKTRSKPVWCSPLLEKKVLKLIQTALWFGSGLTGRVT